MPAGSEMYRKSETHLTLRPAFLMFVFREIFIAFSPVQLLQNTYRGYMIIIPGWGMDDAIQ